MSLVDFWFFSVWGVKSLLQVGAWSFLDGWLNCFTFFLSFFLFMHVEGGGCWEESVVNAVSFLLW